MFGIHLFPEFLGGFSRATSIALGSILLVRQTVAKLSYVA